MRKYEAQTCPANHTHSGRLERRYGQPVRFWPLADIDL